MLVSNPAISETTVRKEWDTLLPAIAPELRVRMRLIITSANTSDRLEAGMVPLDRPNYRFEVMRLLLGADLETDGPQLLKGLMGHIGASQTPIREALAELKASGTIRSPGRGVEVAAEDVTTELLAKLGALPQTLRFRFERGARIKPSAELLNRAEPLLGPNGPKDWKQLALSGAAVAQQDAPGLDLIGTPRLDLVANVARDEKAFDTNVLRLLDDGLELEPNVLAPAPVVVTFVRADKVFVRDAGLGQVRCAYPMDVFLSLLDMGLREQALQYAKAVRP